MKKGILNLIYTTCLVLAFGQILMAQEGSDFAIVRYFDGDHTRQYEGIHVSMNNMPYQKIEVEKSEVELRQADFTPLLKHISAMTETGWMVINSSVDVNGLYFILEKKHSKAERDAGDINK